MLHINDIKKYKEKYIELLKVKNFDADILFESIIEKDNQRRNNQQQIDLLLSRANQISKQIGEFYKSAKKSEGDNLKQESLQIKKEAKDIQDKQLVIEQEIRNILLQIPNIPNPSVPKGNSDIDNVVIRQSDIVLKSDDKLKPHWELAKEYNLIDFDLGNKITGSGFPVYTMQGAKLQRALITYFLEKNIAAGYNEYLPPHLVNEESGFGTANLPDKDGQMYHINEDNLYLIPTAEVPVTNFFRDTIVKDFPIKCTAYTPCFRREAGSYGKDVRGLNRLHQFDKVEIVQVQHPDKSYETLDMMVEHVASILDELGLPYRILKLCGGDLSFASSLTFDFEVFSAGQKKWLEVSSVSNFESYQANRLKLRYKENDGKMNLCHTLNGSALALPRIYAALLENNQTIRGIKIPKVLQKYTGFDILL